MAIILPAYLARFDLGFYLLKLMEERKVDYEIKSENEDEGMFISYFNKSYLHYLFYNILLTFPL